MYSGFVQTKLKVIHYILLLLSLEILCQHYREINYHIHISIKCTVRFKNKEGINQVKAKKTFSSLQDKQKIFTENVSSIVRDG